MARVEPIRGGRSRRAAREQSLLRGEAVPRSRSREAGWIAPLFFPTRAAVARGIRLPWAGLFPPSPQKAVNEPGRALVNNRRAERFAPSPVMDSPTRLPMRNQKYSILVEIKRSNGLSVGELVERLGLSYMGIKQHCNTLEKEGYLSTQRRAKRVGRPEKVYVLTEKADEFFPRKGTPLALELLESVEEIYGSLAVERLLHRLYRRRAEALRPRISGACLAERARQLVQAREEEGCLSRYEPEGAPSGRILEFHSPVLEILDRFPRTRELERRLFEQLLNARVERREDRSGGGFKVAFLLSGGEVRPLREEAERDPPAEAGKPGGGAAPSPAREAES